MRRGCVVVLCGSVGSGKSSVAEAVADELGGVVVASDRVRKRQAGLADAARGGAELYTEERTEATYAGLLERAAPALLSGRVAVLDATYARAALRRDVRAWAERHALPVVLVEARCAPEVARARLAERARRGDDPSDAGPERLEPSRAAFEPPDEWPVDTRLAIATDRTEWRDALRAGLSRLALPACAARA